MTYLPAKSLPWKNEASGLGPPADPATATPLNAAAMTDLENRIETGIQGLHTDTLSGAALPPVVKYAAAPTGVAATDTANLQASITSICSTGGTLMLAAGTYAINASLSFNSLAGTNRGVSMIGAGSGNIVGSLGGSTIIKNSNAGPAIIAYGTLAGATSLPIVSLNLKGFMVQNQVNIGASNYTIDADLVINGGLWEDIYVDGQHLGGNGIRTVNTQNGGMIKRYIVVRRFNGVAGGGNAHQDGCYVTANCDQAANSGNGILECCQSGDSLIHFQVNLPQASGNGQFNSTSFITCKAVNTTDIVGSIGLNLCPNSPQTVVSAFHSERCPIGININGCRGSMIDSLQVSYPAGTPWLTTGTCSNGSTALTVANGEFWNNGDPIRVQNGVSNGTDLVTTVASGGYTTSITLTAAVTNPSGVTSVGIGGTSAGVNFGGALATSFGNEIRGVRASGVDYAVRFNGGANVPAGNRASAYNAASLGQGLFGPASGSGSSPIGSGATPCNAQETITSSGRTGIGVTSRRRELLRASMGWKGETVDFNTALTTTYTLVSGTIQGMAEAMCAGEVVNGIGVLIGNTATLVTLFKVGLYTKSGSRLAVSNDYSATIMGGANIYKCDFATPYTVTTDDLRYLCFLSVFTGTAPTMIRANVSAHVGDQQPSGYRYAVGQVSQSDLGSSQSLGSGNGGIWLAWY